MKNKTLFILACLAGLLAVIIGAFGAHSLDGKITADSLINYKTGVSYQFYHCFASLIALILLQRFKHRFFKLAAIFFLIGIVFFSGSIYLLTTQDITQLGMKGILGPMTPIGGLLFIVGWILLILGIKSSNEAID